MDMVFEYLKMTRVYTKPKGQMPDYSAPVIIRGNDIPTIERFCRKIHRQMKDDFRRAPRASPVAASRLRMPCRAAALSPIKPGHPRAASMRRHAWVWGASVKHNPKPTE